MVEGFLCAEVAPVGRAPALAFAFALREARMSIPPSELFTAVHELLTRRRPRV